MCPLTNTMENPKCHQGYLYRFENHGDRLKRGIVKTL